MDISATGMPKSTKKILKDYWIGGKDALDFEPGGIGTLVSMTMNSSYRVIMGKML